MKNSIEEFRMQNEETNSARDLTAFFHSSFIIRHSSFSL